VGAAGFFAATKAPRIEVAASFYPLAFIAAQVGGQRVAVTNLTPVGAEPHDLELTPKQRDQIEDAHLVIVLGDDFQPAVEKAAAARNGATLEVLDRVRVALRRIERDGESPVRDPHVWLDPALMRVVVVEVAAALRRVDPAGAQRYAANAAALDAEIAALDVRYREGLTKCARRLLVTAHDAFGYLAEAYGLDHEGVSGISPDDEPNPERLGELADLAERRGVTTIFTESLVSPRIARTVAREAGGLKVDVLNPLEGLTARELARGDNYISVMDRNLAKIRRALGCT